MRCDLQKARLMMGSSKVQGSDRQGGRGAHVVVTIGVAILVASVVGSVAIAVEVAEVVVAVVTSVSATLQQQRQAHQIWQGTAKRS